MIIPKKVNDYTNEDKKSMNILFNGIDQVMFESVINSATGKEVWDTTQTLFEGSEQVENKIQLLIQQYEHFHSIYGENFIDNLIAFKSCKMV